VIAAVALHRVALTYVFAVDSSYIYSAFDTRIDHLMIGCLLAVLLRRRALHAFWTRVCSHPAAPCATIAALVLSIQCSEQIRNYREVIGYTLDPLLVAVFIAQVIALSSGKAWSWLDSAPARFLGRISYPLYLYQQLTLYPVREALRAFPVALQLAAAVAVTIGVASLSYYLVEQPFLRLKHRRAAPPRFATHHAATAESVG